MTRRSTLLGLAILLTMAAGPPSKYNKMPTFPPLVKAPPQKLAGPPTPPGFEPAPLPNRDAFAPVTRASKETSVSPSLFTRRDQYRGEGLAASSSAQSEQERRLLPGAGFNLSMPLQ